MGLESTLPSHARHAPGPLIFSQTVNTSRTPPSSPMAHSILGLQWEQRCCTSSLALSCVTYQHHGVSETSANRDFRPPSFLRWSPRRSLVLKGRSSKFKPLIYIPPPTHQLLNGTHQLGASKACPAVSASDNTDVRLPQRRELSYENSSPRSTQKSAFHNS